MLKIEDISCEAPSNLFHAEDAGEYATCACCNKRLKIGSGFVVCVVNGGDRLLDVDCWESEGLATVFGIMGIFDIGPECAKGIPSAYKIPR